MAQRIRNYYLGKKKFDEQSSADFVEVSLVAHQLPSLTWRKGEARKSVLNFLEIITLRCCSAALSYWFVSSLQMMTDRFFLYPTDHAAKDHCYYLKDQYCYRYEMAYSGRKSFLDILHQDSPHEASAALFGEYVSPVLSSY